VGSVTHPFGFRPYSPLCYAICGHLLTKSGLDWPTTSFIMHSDCTIDEVFHVCGANTERATADPRTIADARRFRPWEAFSVVSGWVLNRVWLAGATFRGFTRTVSLSQQRFILQRLLKSVAPPGNRAENSGRPMGARSADGLILWPRWAPLESGLAAVYDEVVPPAPRPLSPLRNKP
jgi:hypothetical protein